MQSIIDGIDYRVGELAREIRILEEARAALVGHEVKVRRRASTRHTPRELTASAERALELIRSNPGANSQQLGIGPRSIASLRDAGAIYRDGDGWTATSTPIGYPTSDRNLEQAHDRS